MSTLLPSQELGLQLSLGALASQAGGPGFLVLEKEIANQLVMQTRHRYLWGKTDTWRPLCGTLVEQGWGGGAVGIGSHLMLP